MRRALLAAALVAAAAAGAADPARASGPFFAQAEFERSYGEGGDTTGFLAGDLGVLVPPLSRWQLFAAYRHLAGTPLSPVESEVLRALWQARLEGRDSVWMTADAALRQWQAARATVAGGSGPPIQPFRSRPDFAFYPNCLPDAFRRAADTLQRRAAAGGAADPAVREWVAAQDTVFSNCGGAMAAIPPALPADRPEWARADRAYQIAAANFYAERFEEAARLFRAIAADASSEWRPLAGYLAVRADLRRATLAPEADRPVLHARAEQSMRELLARPDLGALRASAEGLAAFLRARVRPAERTGELARALARPRSDGGVRQDVADYLDLLAGSGRADGHDMSEWIAAFGDRAADESVRRWRARGGLPWLVAALAAVPPGDPAAPDLLREAAQVGDGSPAEATVRFHQVRLLAGAGRVDEARSLAVSVGRAGGRLGDAGTRNLFAAWRFALARSLAELIELAPRQVVSVSLGERAWYRPAPAAPPILILDADAARVLSEHLPLAMLVEVALAPSLPELVRLHVAQAAWTRAAVLRDERAATQAAQALRALPGSLPAPLAADLGAYERAAPGAERAFAASLVMLRWPGLRPYVVGGISRLSPPLPGVTSAPPAGLGGIDALRQNWWCPPRPRPAPDARAGGRPLPWVHDYYREGVTPRGGLALIDGGAAASPAFLPEGQRRAAATEWAALQALPTAPNHLAAQVLGWVRAHPRDARAAEALALAVRASRFGCVDAATSALSRAAFQTLHAGHADTSWARQTKYWY